MGVYYLSAVLSFVLVLRAKAIYIHLAQLPAYVHVGATILKLVNLPS